MTVGPDASGTVESDERSTGIMLQSTTGDASLGPTDRSGRTTDRKLLAVLLVLKFLQAFGYYGVSIVLTTYLTRELDISDHAAGGMYGFYGMMISVMSILASTVVDHLGIRKSFLVGAILITLSRAALAMSTTRTTAYIILCTTLPAGEALGLPVLANAVGQVSSEADRRWAYGMYYTAMNVAIVTIGPLIDFLRLDENLAAAFGTSPYRFLVWLCACVGASSFLTAYFLMHGFGVHKGIEAHSVSNQGISSALFDSRFRRYLALVGVLVGVRMMFRHLDATFPKYVVRAFGETAPFGIIYAINPVIIMLLVPLLSSVAAKKSEPFKSKSANWTYNFWKKFPFLIWLTSLKPIDSILLGITISTASVCWLATTTTIFASAMFVATLSVGEALWSPRFYDYTFEVAPQGKSGMYFALANVPLFLPKIFAGLMSGYLLEMYCTEDDCHNPRPVWGWILLSCLPFPITMYIFKSRIDQSTMSTKHDQPLAL